MKSKLTAMMALSLFSVVATAAAPSEVLPPVPDALAPHAITAPSESPRMRIELPPIASATAPHAVEAEHGYSYASSERKQSDAVDAIVMIDSHGRIVGTR